MVKVRRYNSLFKGEHPATRQDLSSTWARDHAAQREARRAIDAQAPLPYSTRTYLPDDLPFILDSWCSSYRHAAGSDKIPPDIYKVEQRARISRILTTARVLMLYPTAAPNRPSGWICFEGPANGRRYPILHYVLIHPNLQMKGLAKGLFEQVRSLRTHPEDPIWASHWTIPMRRIMPKWNLIFNPYLLEIPRK